jgi:hypothetical protein
VDHNKIEKVQVSEQKKSSKNSKHKEKGSEKQPKNYD